jgi:hypothetical protein
MRLNLSKALAFSRYGTPCSNPLFVSFYYVITTLKVYQLFFTFPQGGFEPPQADPENELLWGYSIILNYIDVNS